MRKAIMIMLALFVAGAAYADRTALTAETAPGLYPSAGEPLTLTALDTVNLNQLTMTGKGNDILILYNSGASTHNVTIDSVADPVTGRTGSISEEIDAGEYLLYGGFALDGWNNSGVLTFEADHAEVKGVHIRLK